MKEAPLDPDNSIGQRSACFPGVAGRLVLRFRESSDEIGAADDADDAAIAEHRHALYAVGGQHPCDLRDLGLLTDRDHRRRHYIACTPLRRTQAREKIGVEHLAFREHGQPPVATSLAFRFVAADEVALADHADGGAVRVDYGHRADPMVAEDLCDLADRRVGADRVHRRGHHVACFHPWSLTAGSCIASLLLTSTIEGSFGSGAATKPSWRHICSIGSFSRKTSPKSSPMPCCRATRIRRVINR